MNNNRQTPPPPTYSQVIKALPQACPTFSQLEELDRQTSSSSPPQPSTPTPPEPLQPANYTPTGYAYNFTNFGLPYYEDHYQYFNLTNGGIDWRPSSPTTLILSMQNCHVLKVGLQPSEVKTLNSIKYEMHRAMSAYHYTIDT